VLETDGLSEFSEKLRVYPYGNIVLVFHYNHPFLFQKRDEPAELEPRTVICGQQTTYYDLTPVGKVGMVFVVFKPYGAGMFFKIPMNEIADKNIAFEHIVKIETCEMEDKIQNASSMEERICIIDNYLVKKLIQNHNNGEQIIHAFNKIYQKKGEISVKKLADTACLSIKQFERKFSGLVGVNPKQFLRTVRFQHVLQMKKSRRFLDYTSLAMECGYFDQSHFINDFKTITGLTPGEFFQGKPAF
jgi:AraC-like DNA-binding protein